MTKSSFFKTLTGFAAGLLVLACTPTVIPELSLSDLAANFEATGALEKTVSVTSNVDWTVSCPDAWVTVSPSTGTGNGTFKISVQENKAFEARTSTVTVKAGDKSSTVKVSQLGLTPSILVAPATLEIEAAGGTVSADVTSNSPWTVSVPSDGNWATPDATSGEGNKKVTFTVTPNTAFEARSVEITFTAQDKKATVKITQAAPAPTLEVNPTAISVEADGGAQEITVTSNAPWTVTAAEDWITVEPASGEGDGKVVVTVAANIARATRSATVTFKETAGGAEKTVTVSQEMARPSRQTDSLALVSIYNASKGAEWKEGRVWDLTQPIDQWYGVTLNAAGRVTALKLLKGTITAGWLIPADIADLDELTDLRFIDCKVAGDIPDALYHLTKLQNLYLTNNDITGALNPMLFGQWTEMKNLYLDQNPNLGGTLPSKVGKLTKLESINISQTHISGTIPAELVGCVALKNFMAYKTLMNGYIPEIWDQLPALEIVQLYGIYTMAGPMPTSFGNCKKLKSLWLYDCNFTGNIPESWANLPSTCTQLRIQGNCLKGVVPAAIQEHANFEKWNAAKYILPQQDGYGLTLRAGSGGQNLDQPVDEDPWN